MYQDKQRELFWDVTIHVRVMHGGRANGPQVYGFLHSMHIVFLLDSQYYYHFAS